MKRFLMLAAVLAMIAGVADAKSCKDPKTHLYIKCPAAAASSAPAMSSMASSTKKAPNCKVGIPCGGTCIAKGKTCHIKP